MRAVATQGINLFRALMIYLTPVLPRMSEAAGQFLGLPIHAWSDAATPLLDVPLNPYQPLATRLDPAIVNRLVELPPPANSAPAATSSGIGIEDFSRIELRVARVTGGRNGRGLGQAPAAHAGSGRARRVRSFPESVPATRPSSSIGRLVVVVANLEPRKMRFGVSAGMVLCASGEGEGVFLLSADSGAQPGMKVT